MVGKRRSPLFCRNRPAGCRACALRRRKVEGVGWSRMASAFRFRQGWRPPGLTRTGTVGSKNSTALTGRRGGRREGSIKGDAGGASRQVRSSRATNHGGGSLLLACFLRTKGGQSLKKKQQPTKVAVSLNEHPR